MTIGDLETGNNIQQELRCLKYIIPSLEKQLESTPDNNPNDKHFRFQMKDVGLVDGLKWFKGNEYDFYDEYMKALQGPSKDFLTGILIEVKDRIAVLEEKFEAL